MTDVFALMLLLERESASKKWETGQKKRAPKRPLKKAYLESIPEARPKSKRPRLVKLGMLFV